MAASNSGAYTRILHGLLVRHQPFALSYGQHKRARDDRQRQLCAMMNDFWGHLVAWVIAGHRVHIPGLGMFCLKQHASAGPVISFRPVTHGSARLRLDRQLPGRHRY